MKILTWNINGIRSVKKEKSLKSLFDSLDVDVICLQETKVTREMLEEETAIVDGYNAYFSFSKVRSGYSGVATFCRDNITPIKAEDKIYLPENYAELDNTNEEKLLTNEEIEALNAEGRTVLTEHLDSDGNHVVIINLYCPRADLDNKERIQFKLGFYSLVQQKCKSLIGQNKQVIVLGDFNVSHKMIDHCDPNDPEIFDSNPSRQWANTFIMDSKHEELDDATTKLVDSFRFFHPDQESAFTCWSTVTGARQTNYGTRIDYIFSSVNLFKKEFSDCVIRPDIEGSDHCPVVATLKRSFKNAGKPPSLCTKYMPEFAGKQQKLKAFFKKKDIQTDIISSTKNENKAECTNINKDVGLKGSEKRPGAVLHASQPKRLKTVSNSSKCNILNFFSKTNTKRKTNGSEQTSKVKKDNFDEERRRIKKPELNSCKSESQNSRIVDMQKIQPENRSFNNRENNFNIGSVDSKSLSQTSTASSQNSTPLSQTSTASSQTTTSSQNSTSPSTSQKNPATAVAQWKNILKGLPPAPLCPGHNEPSVLRTVKNKGPNHGKQFYCCARPEGHKTNKDARCNFFKWVKK